MSHLRIILILLSISSLTSCSLFGGGSSTDGSIEGSTHISKNSISMDIPSDWGEAKGNDIPTPRRWTVVGAYTASGAVRGFIDNLVIMKDSLSGLITSMKYSEINHLQTTRNYLEYSDIESSDITFSDTDTSKVYVFQARYNDSTPKMQFLQTAKVCGSTVYLLHFSISPKETPDTYVKMLETFQCK